MMINLKYIRTADIKHNIYFMYVAFSFFLMCISACKKNNDPQANSVYITQAVQSSTTFLGLDNTGSANINIASAYTVNEDVKVSVTVDSNYLKAYNEKNGTDYVLFPQSAFTLSSQSTVISNGQALAQPIVLTANNFENYNYALQYAIPVKIAATSNGIPAINGQSTILVVIAKTIHSTASTITDNNSGTAQAYQYDNNKLFASAPGSTSVIPVYTVEGRFKVSNRFNGGTRWFYSLFQGANGVFFVIRNGNNGGDVRNPGDLTIQMGGVGSPTLTNLTLNTWYHFALEYDSKSITVYLDGKAVYHASAGSGLQDYSPEGIGSFAGSTGLTLSEYRVWKTLRSARQLVASECYVDPTNPDLLAYWKFDQTDNPFVVKDLTGNGNDLTKGNATIAFVATQCP
ncbi:MAG: DUF1735 domain-containing protein [Niabella sp.]